ncbi:hypothetical protein GCM10027063_37640 [Promicromonospora xylanilytica]
MALIMPPYGPDSPDNAKDQAFKPPSMVSPAPVMNATEVPVTKATGDAPVQDAVIVE